MLADGTGNSAANPFKTNVWRLYQAVDIQPNLIETEQVVLYNDGVGTGSFRPLVLLGLAFGIGLARNVKDLYTFVCRNYSNGDSIYLFGFSRGAFTVRILSGLILRCGLVTASNEADLKDRVQLAYDEYKRDMARRATRTRPWLIAGHVLGGWRRGENTDHIKFNFDQVFPRIRFVGVWDTVDAYGMPVDELKVGIDRHVWPMTLADRELSEYVDRVCHALSLDDERPTFRPVLWTEPPNEADRLRQVWFAGAHANVGGGYPDDGLANVTLQWMMDEATNAGLRLYAEHVQECNRRANAHGEHHDSRAGLAGYYRYGPRDVDALCDDPEHGVQIAVPQIHQSVVERIRERRVGYAPISFPNRFGYGMVQRGPAPPLVGAPPVETQGQVAARDNDMNTVRDAVARRKVAYHATVALTSVLVALPLVDWLTGYAYRGYNSAAIPVWSDIARFVSAVLSWMLALGFLPGWTAPWFDAFAHHSMLFLIAGVLLLWLFIRRSVQIQDQVFARAEYAWREI